MPTVLLWSEVEYENVSFRFSQVASNLKMFFSQRFVSCEEKIFDICLKSVKKDWISHKSTHHTKVLPRCVSFLHRTSFHGCLKCARNHHRRTSRLWIPEPRVYKAIAHCECFPCKKVAGVTCFRFLQFHFYSPYKWFSWMLRQIGECILPDWMLGFDRFSNELWSRWPFSLAPHTTASGLIKPTRRFWNGKPQPAGDKSIQCKICVSVDINSSDSGCWKMWKVKYYVVLLCCFHFADYK